MRTPAILLLSVCLAAAGCGGDALDDGPAGEIRGAPLRSAPRAATVEAPAEPAAPEPEPEPAAPAAPEPGSGPGLQPAPEPTAPPIEDGAPLEVTLAQLGSFPFEPPEGQDPDPAAWDAQIPDAIRALHGRRITIEGFITPIKVAERKVVRVLFTIGHFGCCFGAVPKMNEWIVIDMAEDVAMAHAPLDPVRFTGRLEVGGLIDEQRYLYAIYHMQADSHEVVGKH